MGTRAVVVVGVVGAVLFGFAAFLLTAGGDEPSVPAAAKSSSGSSSNSGSSGAVSAPGKTPTPSGPAPGAASNEKPATVIASDIEGAVVPATPVVAPAPEEMVKNGGLRFAIPLRKWAVIGDRFGAPRSDGRIHGGINFVLAEGATQEVYASCDGIVTAGDTDPIYGKYLAVDCGDGWLTLYGNIKEQKVPAKTNTAQGETVLATVEGFLYFEIRYARVPVDGEPYLDFSVPAGRRRPDPGDAPVPPDPTETATPSVTGTATKTATPRPGSTSTPVPSGGDGGGSDGGEEPTSPPATSGPANTPTRVPPTATPTDVPPTPTATSTPTPRPPTPTRTPTPLPVY